MQVGQGEQKSLLTKIYNFYWAQGKVYLNDGRNIKVLEADNIITHAS